MHCSLGHKEHCKVLKNGTVSVTLGMFWCHYGWRFCDFLKPTISSWVFASLLGQFSQLIAKKPPAPLALLVIERHVCLIPAPRTKKQSNTGEMQGTLRCTFWSERSAKPFQILLVVSELHIAVVGPTYTLFIRILRNIPRLSLVFECQIMPDRPNYTLAKVP